MARGTTLGELVEMLRLEVGQSSNPALGQNVRPALVHRLKKKQEELYDKYDWPFLRVRRDKIIAAGQRYYDLPDDLNLERVEKVEMFWGDFWHPLVRGITMDDYSIHNSDADERVDPVLKWDVIDVGSGEQIEFWPIPVINGSATAERVRFTGIKALPSLTSDSDIAVLDDIMITQFVAAEILAHDNKKDAQLKFSMANDRLATLRGRLAPRKRFRMSGPSRQIATRLRPIRVAYAPGDEE